jgi:hypothetical protein
MSMSLFQAKLACFYVFTLGPDTQISNYGTRNYELFFLAHKNPEFHHVISTR